MTMHDHRGTEDTDEIAVNPLFARDGEETIPRGASRTTRCCPTRRTSPIWMV
jgi:hypothetical protein